MSIQSNRAIVSPFASTVTVCPGTNVKTKKTIAQANVNVSYIHTLLPSLSCFLKEPIAQYAISIASSNTPSPYTILIFPPVFYDHITNLYIVIVTHFMCNVNKKEVVTTSFL